MNTLFKISSAAVLSAVALSVAALSVPAIQVHALKLLDKMHIKQSLVANITVENKSVIKSPAGESIEIAFTDADLLRAIAPAEKSVGSFGRANVMAGTGGGSVANGQPSGRGASSMSGAGSSSAGGLGFGGSSRGGAQGSGGASQTPVPDGSGEKQALAPEEVPLTIAEEKRGGGETDSSIPVSEVLKDVADLPDDPSVVLLNDPVNTADANKEVQLAAAVSAVPEPGTLALLGIALLGLGAFRRQRAQR